MELPWLAGLGGDGEQRRVQGKFTQHSLPLSPQGVLAFSSGGVRRKVPSFLAGDICLLARGNFFQLLESGFWGRGHGQGLRVSELSKWWVEATPKTCRIFPAPLPVLPPGTIIKEGLEMQPNRLQDVCFRVGL